MLEGGAMKVILLQDIPKLGKDGDVVEVASGYARNFLIPRGLAEVATPEQIAIIAKRKEKERKLREKQEQEAKILAEKLEHTSCTIPVKAGEEDRLFGAVTVQDIADALAKEGIQLDKKKIVLEGPIKKLGVYNIPVKVSQDIAVSFKLWVVKE